MSIMVINAFAKAASASADAFDSTSNFATFADTGGAVSSDGDILTLTSSGSLYSYADLLAQQAAGWTSIKLAFDVRFSAGSNCDFTAGLIFSASSTGAVTTYSHSNRATSAYAVNVRPSSFSERIARIVSSSVTMLRDQQDVTPATGSYVAVEITFTNTGTSVTIDLKVGGVSAPTYTDSSGSRLTGACYPAFAAFGTGGNNVKFNNLVVTRT